MPPLLILALGIATVIGMIVLLRSGAFFALITAALLVSLLAPGEWPDKVARVATAFGSTAGGIGIVIALAAVIGMCMQESHAADRVVRWFLGIFGFERGEIALLASAFVLSIPVFFDTVFYLLVPLARSMYRRTGRGYAKYITVIAGGAVATHSLVPPTPGPLANAANLGVDLGTMILVGLAVATPGAIVAIFAADRIDARLNIAMRPLGDSSGGMGEPEPPSDDQLPSLGLSLLPILLPVLLIASNTVLQAAAPQSPLLQWTAVIGNPNMAMLAAATVALWLWTHHRSPTRDLVTSRVEASLMSGGLIILITAAGGAFGAMLQAAQIGAAIQDLFGGTAGSGPGSGMTLLFAGFLVAVLLKFAQGSSTVAMITTSAMFAGLLGIGAGAGSNPPVALGFHPVYIATAIGSGAMVGSWMNDSGFWIISKMGVLTEAETFQTWTAIAAIVGCTGFATTLLLALLLPLV